MLGSFPSKTKFAKDDTYTVNFMSEFARMVSACHLFKIGGRVQVFEDKIIAGEKVISLDVASLYPFVATSYKYA